MSESTVTVLAPTGAAGPERADGSPVFTGKPATKRELAQDREPWERQPFESAEAFEAFKLYRDGGPKRSRRRVAERLAKSETLMSRWQGRHRWRERVEAYDRERDRQEQRILAEEFVRAAQERVRTGRRGISATAKKILEKPDELSIGQAIAAMDGFRKLTDVGAGQGKAPALANTIENVLIAVAQEKVDAREITD